MGKLLPFQEVCVNKLVDQPFCIVADDMGLGKTIEGMALDAERRKKHPGAKKTLVIAPKSVVPVWVEHFAEWQPHLKVTSLDPKDRGSFLAQVKAGSHDVYIMHWDVVRLLPELATYPWFHILADEAHRAANREAQVTMRSKKIKRQYLTLLTGTPCTTRPEQFWSLLNWCDKKRFSSYNRFFDHHVIYVQHQKSDFCMANPNGVLCGKEHKNAFKVIIGVAHENELLGEIAPYYIRRLKEEVLPDLPEKYYSRITVELDPQQRRVYNEMRDEMLAWIGEHEDEPLPAPMAIAKLVRLQQLAMAYAQFTPTLVRKKHEHENTDEQKCYNDDGDLICDKVWDEKVVNKVTLIEPSSKLDAVMEILRDNPDKQFVVFSQSKQIINLLARRLENKGIEHGILTGDTSQEARGTIVKEFQAGRLRVFAGTISAGGVGLTLTAASTVIFIDRAWSPAHNHQAEDRCHRIGQKNAVHIIDIIARDTIDAGRLQRIESSWNFIKRLLGDKDAKIKPEGAYV